MRRGYARIDFLVSKYGYDPLLPSQAVPGLAFRRRFVDQRGITHTAKMDSAATIALGIATVLMSGVVSSVVTYRLNRNKEQVFFMRQKAEALYLAADDFGKNLSIHTIPFFKVASGDIDYNQMLDIEIGKGNSGSRGHETLNMMVRIYFPELETHLERLDAARNAWSKATGLHKAAYKNGDGVGPQWTALFLKSARDIDEAIKALQAAIVVSARRYTISPIKRRRT